MQQNNSNKDAVFEIDLMKLLRECVKYWWLILLCVAVTAGAMLIYTVKFVTPTYRASCSLYINNTKSDVVYDTQTTSNISASQSLVTPYITALKKNVFLSDVADKLDGEYTVNELRKIISASQSGSTQFLDIYATTSDPVESARIANVVYELVPQIIPTIIRGSSAEPIDYPEVPTQRYSPNYRKNVMIGAVVGVLLALVIITLRYLLDVRIRSAEDLENLTSYPILGRIPQFTMETKKHEGYGYGYGAKAASAEKEGKA